MNFIFNLVQFYCFISQNVKKHVEIFFCGRFLANLFAKMNPKTSEKSPYLNYLLFEFKLDLLLQFSSQ